jgi:hypothetical protein
MRMLGENRKKFAPRAPLIGIALRRMIKGVDRQDFKLKMSENPNAQNDDTRIRLISVEKKKTLKSDNNIEQHEEMANSTEQEDSFAEYELKSSTEKANKIEHDDSKAEYNLEPHHTHFFLVEETEEKNNSVEQSRRARACFERDIRNRKGNRRWAWSFKRHGDLVKVPYVCVCIEGGVGCISQVYLIAMEGMAVLCVKGTGRAADFLGDLALLRFDDQDNTRYIPWKYKTQQHRNFCEFMNQVDREQQGSTSKAR